MSKIPKIALVGRPNVGKSALFNRICKERIAIVDEAEGITRDRLYAKTDLFGYPLQVIDTGGINPRSQQLFNDEVKRQAEIAIEEADSIIMVVDSKIGVTELDEEVARILLRTKKPLCLAVNKVDDREQVGTIYPFQLLGITKMVAVSATQNWQIAELMETAFEDIKDSATLEEAEEDTSIKISIVGRPNVGKSSLANNFLQEERCIVSPLPGTTRDSIDMPFEEGAYTLIDTAGIRKKQVEKEAVEKFSAIRTERAIERSDVCLLMLDAREGMTAHEKRIASHIEKAGKGCILLFNKWDLVKGFRMEHCIQQVEQEVPFLKHCPKLFISANTGRNVDKILPLVQLVFQFANTRITTHQLNTFVEKCLQKTHPPMLQGKRLRIYYMAQIEVTPPKFVLFVNSPDLMTDTYKRYLINQFRETYSFTGVPITFYLKRKQQKISGQA